MEEQQKERNNKLVIGTVFAIVTAVAAGFYVLHRENLIKNSTSSSTTGTATTTMNIGGVTIEIPPGSKASVEVENLAKLPPAPNLDRSVSFPASFPQEARPIWLKNFADLKVQLAKIPQSYDLWLSVGSDWKMIEDYEGARQAWEYASKLAPTDSVVFGNLGFLYGYYLKDSTKAQENFKIALHNGPQQLYIYQQAFEFYRDVLKDKTKARTLAEDGKRITGTVEFFDTLLQTL